MRTISSEIAASTPVLPSVSPILPVRCGEVMGTASLLLGKGLLRERQRSERPEPQRLLLTIAPCGPEVAALIGECSRAPAEKTVPDCPQSALNSSSTAEPDRCGGRFVADDDRT